ncbi:uncharacterized protein LOC135090346 [Scylla paramamosain]|uniref:uncharacterized protein LOC135090346 n=1 Tax=Scylla paramamosain TaxID=85552 RepID=UPI003083C7E3
MERRSVLLLAAVVVVAALAGSVGAACPSGFQPLPYGACVKLWSWDNPNNPSWDIASEACKKEGGQLISLDTPEKMQQFSTHVFGVGDPWRSYFYCVGATKTESGWRWLNGAELSSRSYMWYPGDPDGIYTQAHIVSYSNHPRHYISPGNDCTAAACETNQI